MFPVPAGGRQFARGGGQLERKRLGLPVAFDDHADFIADAVTQEGPFEVGLVVHVEVAGPDDHVGGLEAGQLGRASGTGRLDDQLALGRRSSRRGRQGRGRCRRSIRSSSGRR